MVERTHHSLSLAHYVTLHNTDLFSQNSLKVFWLYYFMYIWDIHCWIHCGSTYILER